MASKLGPVKFRVGQWVVWGDEDEGGVMQPHSGRVEGNTVHDGNRFYLIEETDTEAKEGFRLMIVLEEELSPLTQN